VAPNIFIIMRGSYLAPTYFKKKRRGARGGFIKWGSAWGTSSPIAFYIF
jgi:hypothetical protein